MREYAVVCLTAALVTFLTTPVVRVLAMRLKVVSAVRERDVHVIPTPRGGGVAMYAGWRPPSWWPAGCRRCSGPSRTPRPTRCWSPVG
ncbi:hypothetical protein ACFQX8_14665 [Klenkia terrae]|uniref:hypothetical protein n=1 Tax=Klenkia terrae TaxID=1052259 RepID=UPI003612401B